MYDNNRTKIGGGNEGTLTRDSHTAREVVQYYSEEDREEGKRNVRVLD